MSETGMKCLIGLATRGNVATSKTEQLRQCFLLIFYSKDIQLQQIVHNQFFLFCFSFAFSSAVGLMNRARVPSDPHEHSPGPH